MRESSISVYPVQQYVLVDIYDDGETTVDLGNGKKIILLNDTDFSDPTRNTSDDSHPGIRPRWAIVRAVADYAKERGVKLGDKVLCDTLKWSRGFQYDNSLKRVWRIPADDIILVDDAGFTDDELEHIAERRS